MAGKPVPVADKAIAEAALTALFELAEFMTPADAAAYLIETASKIRFQPSTRQLIVTIDLAMGGDTPGE